MSRIKFTARAIAKLKAPDPSGKQKPHWDTELTGFGVLCSGVSTAKSYIVQRDLPGKKTRRVTIAPVNVLSISQARERARAVLADLYAGKDPKAGRRRVMTLRGALDAYLAARKELRPKSAHNYRFGVEKYLAAWLDRPLREITPDMVEARHRNLQEEVEAKGRTAGNVTANTTMRSLSILWNFALEREPGLGPNSVSRLRRQWYPVYRRERVVPADKLPAFYAAIDALPNPIQRDYMLLLLFTGLRRSEAASLTWDDVDFGQRTFRVSAMRTKSGRRLDLPMTDFVHDLFVRRRAPGTAHWVFPANSAAGHIAEPQSIFKRIAASTGIRVSPHDLRRVYLTVAESCDISVLALKALVNHHLGGGVTEGYVQMSAERLRVPAQKVCDRIKELCGIAPIADDRTVHNLRGR
jgi:integrase